MKMINIIMILIIILINQESFSTIPSIVPNPHYFYSQELK